MTPNVKRWKNIKSIDPAWEQRTRLMSQYIPTNTRVIEFGAGRAVLGKYLKSGCTYQPTDVFPRDKNMLAVDLNADSLVELPGYDVAFLSGVIEYILNPGRFFRYCSKHFRNIICSYAVAEGEINGQLENRKRCDWVNHFTNQQFVDLLRQCGYSCGSSMDWEQQKIYHFQLLHGEQR